MAETFADHLGQSTPRSDQGDRLDHRVIDLGLAFYLDRLGWFKRLFAEQLVDGVAEGLSARPPPPQAPGLFVDLDILPFIIT